MNWPIEPGEAWLNHNYCEIILADLEPGVPVTEGANSLGSL